MAGGWAMGRSTDRTQHGAHSARRQAAHVPAVEPDAPDPRPEPGSSSPDPDWPAWLRRFGGQMGARIADFDWAGTPLGPLPEWSESLRTAVSMCVSSRFPITIWWGEQFTVLYNDACRPIFGDTRDPWALGSPASEVWPETWSTAGPVVSGLMAGGTATWAADARRLLNRTIPAEECYFTFSYSPIPDEDGVGGVLCVLTETTKQVLAERRLAALTELTDQLAGLTDPDDVIAAAVTVLTANPGDHPLVAIRRITTAEDGEVLLDPPPADAARWPEGAEALALAAAAYGTSRSLMLEQAPSPAQPGLETAVHAVHAIPVIEPGHQSASAVLLVGQNPHRVWDDELGDYLETCAASIATALSSMRELAEERRRTDLLVQVDAAKSDFFANVSHELRTPLTLIAGPVADALADSGEPLPAALRERLRLVERNVVRLARMVDAMLDFSRMEAGRLGPQTSVVEVGAFTRTLASAFAPAMESAGLEFVVDCPDLPRHAVLDRDMYERVVLNLLSNALKYTRRGSVVVRLADSGTQFSLTVSDTGIGIAAKDHARVFERFAQLPRRAGARSWEGAGIGLAMVKQLTELMGGTVTLTSAVGRGSAFTVRLPYEVAVPEDAMPRQSVTPRRAEHFLAEVASWQDGGESEEGEPGDEVPGSDDAPGEGTPGQGPLVVETPGQGSLDQGQPGQGSLDQGPPGQGSFDQGPPGQGVPGRRRPAPEAPGEGTHRHGGPRRAGFAQESRLDVGPGVQVSAHARPRLLIAEDNADMRRYLRDILSTDYDVRTAADGLQALAALRDAEADALLADVMIPGLDGLGLLTAVRRDPRLQHLPVLLLSAQAGDQASISGLEHGADDYVVKPFSAADLRARLAANLTRARARLRDAAWRRAVMASLQDAVLIADAAGRVLEVNDAFTRLLGWTTAEGPLRPPYPWWPDAAEPAGVIHPEVTGEVVYRRRDGSPVWVSVASSAVEVPGEGPGLQVTTVRDVTREHAARERRATAALVAGEFATGEDLDQMLSAAVAGFGEVFEGRAVVEVVTSTTDEVFTEVGPVSLTALPPALRRGLAGELDEEGTDADEAPGLLLVPRGSDSCRAWIRFDRPRRVLVDERIVGDLLVEALALAIDRLVAADEFADRQTHLQRAIESHRLIGQAIGILVERHRLTPSDAFWRLKKASQDRNIKLRDIAARLVETGEETDGLS